MKKIAVLFLLVFSILSLSAQQYKPTYDQLKTYEGVYEYQNNTTLQIAASPKSLLLYAIIGKSRYPLRPQSPDLFLNSGNQAVKFIRGADSTINGYVTDNKTFKLLNRNVFFPHKMWYPREVADPQNFVYSYHIPDKLNDGLSIGSITRSGLDTALIGTMMHKIVAGDYPNIHSMLIIKNGKLVFEEYFYEYGRDSLQEQRSATKSAVSALTGIAIKQGLIKSVNDKMESYFPEYHFKDNTELKQQITVGDLLSNQSGVSYDEAYNKAAGNESEMSYTDDWVKYTFNLPMLDTPGKVGRYNSGNPITLARIIEKTSGMPIHDFAVKNLYGPMGITNFKWPFKADKSNAETFGEVFLRPRDMAKFGLLYLNNGVWNNEQVVPAAWVAASTSKHAVVQGVDYGYLWWLKHLDADGVRYQTFGAQGNGGQKIYVFKSLDMVIVTTGGNYNSQSPTDELLKKYILPSFSKK